MNEHFFFNGLLTGWMAVALAVFVLLFFINAPYGRHQRPGWGPRINNRAGWFIMEAIPAIVMFILFIIDAPGQTPTTAIFLVMWEAHYMHRGLIYPFTLRSAHKQMPVIIMSFGMVFNLINTYLNGRHIFTFSNSYTASWLWDLRFLLGLLILICGYVINRKSDHILKQLRINGTNEYRIPVGGLYRWISSPNYLGEIIIWGGWALATWSLPGLAFAIWTTANLVPRARANHAWLKTKFADYPPERKALIPTLW